MDYDYGKEEMEMREFAFEIAKCQATIGAWLSIAEWEVMKNKYNFTDKDFPALAANVNSMREMLRIDSPAHEAIFNNPLTKLAVISQPMEKKEEKKDEHKDSNDGNSN